MAFSPFGKTAEWLDLCHDAEARSEKIGDESRQLASIAVRAAALNFYGTPYEAITAGEQAVALADRLADATWLGFAEYGLGQAYFLAGRYRDAGRVLDENWRIHPAVGTHLPGGCVEEERQIHHDCNRTPRNERCSAHLNNWPDTQVINK